MNLVLTVLQIVAPVFAVAAVGYGWVKLGFEYRTAFVTRLAANFAVPCLVFTALVTAEIAPEAMAELMLASLAAYALAGIALAAVLVAVRLPRRVYLAPLIFNNTGNLGLPLALFAFGDEGLALGVIVFAVTSILAFSVGIWIVSGRAAPHRVLREPLVVASALGAVFLWQGWQPPEVAMRTLELIGQMAIPLMLLTLGVAVARIGAGGWGRAFALSLAKLGLCTGAGVAVGLAMGLSPVPFAVLVLQMSTPVAVTSYLVAERFNTDPEAVAGLVVVSTLLAVLSLPAVLGFVI